MIKRLGHLVYRIAGLIAAAALGFAVYVSSLHGPPNNNLRRHARRARRDVAQLITREGKRAPLLSASPIRKGAALNVQHKGLPRLTLLNAVGSEVGDAALGDVPALLHGLGKATVGGELGQVAAQKDERVVAVAAKYQRATRVGTVHVHLHLTRMDGC